jgi:hypothetical protein
MKLLLLWLVDFFYHFYFILCFLYIKKRLKIPKEQSEAVNRKYKGATRGTWTLHPFRSHESITFTSVLYLARCFVFCVVYCRSLFVIFHLTIMLSLFRFTASDCSFGIFKRFFMVMDSCDLKGWRVHGFYVQVYFGTQQTAIIVYLTNNSWH